MMTRIPHYNAQAAKTIKYATRMKDLVTLYIVHFVLHCNWLGDMTCQAMCCYILT